MDCHGSAAHHRWAQNTGAENEYFHLLRTLKDQSKRELSMKILEDIVTGMPDVLHGQASKPRKTKGQDFTCPCIWLDPVRRAAEDGDTDPRS